MVDLSELGSFTLENTVNQVRFPERERGKKSRLKYMLGKGISTDDPSEAADHFLDREFPQLRQEDPHSPLFVPDTFIYKHFPEKYVVAPDGRKANQEDDVLRKRDNNFMGQQQEEELFSKLKKCFDELMLKNITVFSGWDDNNMIEGDPHREFDFLIVSDLSKTIIHIEVKHSNQENNKPLKKAIKQLNQGYNLFQERIPFPNENGWKYIKAVYFEVNLAEWSNTKHEFVLGPTSDLKYFFQKYMAPSNTQGDNTYLQIVKFLMFVMFQAKKAPIIIPREAAVAVIENVDIVGSPENIIFWSKDQLKTMEKNVKRVFLAAPYGTGKTTLLRTKLRRSISESVNPNNNNSSCNNNKKFVFIIFEDSREYMRDSLLKMDIEKEFKDVPEEISLHVYNVKNRAGTWLTQDTRKRLDELIIANKDANFFMDEMPLEKFSFQSSKLGAKGLEKLASYLKEDSLLWVSCRSLPDKKAEIEILKSSGFEMPQLFHPLRNTANILGFAQIVKEATSGDTSWPQVGIDANHYLQRGGQVEVLSVKPTAKLEHHGVEEVIKIVKRLNLPTVIKLESRIDEISQSLCSSDEIKAQIKMDSEEDDVKNFIEDVKKIDESPDYKAPILLVTTEWSGWLRGFEIPVLVVFGSSLAGSINDNVISRCISNLIMVFKEEHVKNLRESHFYTKKEISGKIMTQNFEEACICDAVEVVSQLLDEDDSVHFVNRKEQTGLIVAVENGSENVAKLLLDKNSNLEAEGEDRCNAMEIAVKKGYSNIVFLILEKTLDIYYCDQDGNSALKLAILNHKLEMVKALLDKGADINAVDKEERTPLMLSVINHETEMAKVLLDKGTDINAVDRDGRTALMYAVINRETEMVKVLFDKGSDYKTRDKEGWTAFQRANEDHDQDLILLYMECVKARQKKEGLIQDPEPPTPVHQEPVQTPPPNDNEEDNEEKDVWEKIKDKLGEGVKKVDTFFVENDPGPGIGSALAPLRDVIENLF